MTAAKVLDALASFGLTASEAKLYAALHGLDAATGYELAKTAGLPRANAYAALAGLADKGAAALLHGKPVRYRAVPVEEFAEGVIARLEKDKSTLARSLAAPREHDAGYLTLRGADVIAARIRRVIAATRSRIYLSFPAAWLEPFRSDLARLAETGVKVVIITNSGKALPGAVLHHSHRHAGGFRLISDSTVAMTGELDPPEDCTCLYARKRNLAALLKESIRNEITLITLSTGGEAAAASA